MSTEEPKYIYKKGCIEYFGNFLLSSTCDFFWRVFAITFWLFLFVFGLLELTNYNCPKHLLTNSTYRNLTHTKLG